ncbi:MAG: PKD domain-containing protein [Rhodoglobus sp.]|nr:PKD domain-containing protein [Rhodoglobus sp.]
MLIETLALGTLLTGIDGCGERDYYLGACSYNGTFDGGGATLDGRGSTPGSGIDVEDGTSGDTGEQECDAMWLNECLFWISEPPSESVTWADVAHFVPDVGTHSMEPDGWAVIGLSTNFISSAAPHTLSGTVLGSPADVRFTPVSWHWDFGDGESRSSWSPGASWASLGVGEFAETDTSHRFRERGTFTVTLRVELEAEYRIRGGSWAPIAGTLAVDAAPLTVLARSARTVLVDEDCIRNPAGPGC